MKVVDIRPKIDEKEREEARKEFHRILSLANEYLREALELQEKYKLR